MTIEQHPRDVQEEQLKAVEAAALKHMDTEAGHVEEDLESAARASDVLDHELDEKIQWRPIIAVALTTVCAAVMVGGVFNGASPRIYAAVAGLLGIALAVGLARVRQPVITYFLAFLGIFAIGILLVVPDGIDKVLNLRALVQQAAQSGKLLRPPVNFVPGWVAVTGWIMAAVGFGSAWTAAVIKRPSVAILLPMPLAAVAAISVSKVSYLVGPFHASDQILSGLVVVILFGAALGSLSGGQIAGGQAESLPLAYELRRTLGALPLFLVITVGLFFLAQSNALFPKPLYDPTQEPQKPKSVPLSQVEDKNLFEVTSNLSGPWKLGSLDVYTSDGSWRLPPIAGAQFTDVPKSGIVDRTIKPGARAEFKIRGLTGAVLPGLPNTVGVAASGPKLAYDSRSGNIRLVEGTFQDGFPYVVTAEGPPSVDGLASLGTNPPVPPDIQQFKNIPPAPLAVRSLIDQAPKDSLWTEYDWLRHWVLNNVTVSGLGTPAPVTISRANEIIDRKEGSPYEIVAIQAMLARWIGLPARIGYGFDGGTLVNGHLEVHPINGVSFPEVYFAGFKWVPVIGTPVHAKASEGSNTKKTDNNVLPSDDISVPLFLPYLLPADVQFYEIARQVLVIALPIILALLIIYFGYPAVVKLRRRAVRRHAAALAGPRAEISLAYAEWRDHATDFGYRFDADTPLMFVDRFIPDEEHAQFSWLVTRSLYGDLQKEVTPAMVTNAKELSRVLRNRLSAAHPVTQRTVAFFSRLSLRYPYDTDSVSHGAVAEGTITGGGQQPHIRKTRRWMPKWIQQRG